MFAGFVARRYLFSPKSRSVINLIAGLSVVSIAMPVAAMIILLSVFNGFETLVKSMCSAFDADLTVTPVRGQTFALEAIDSAALAHIDGVLALSYVLEQSALIERDGRQTTATLRGVDDGYAAVLPSVADAVTSGEYRVRLGDYDRLVVGRAMAYTLGLQALADSDVSIYALRRGNFSSLLPIESYTRRTVSTAGVYTLDLETEQQYILTSLRLAQELFSYDGKSSALLLRVDPRADVEQLRSQVAEAVGADFRVRTRSELRASFYAIMTYEKWGIFFISLLVLIIASFSIVGALAMLITDKRDDLVTLRALGASTPILRRVFHFEGGYISAIGAMIGVMLGVGLSLAQQHLGWIEIPADTFLTKSYPVEFRWVDLAVVVGSFCVVTLCITRLTVYNMIKNEKR
ncbi:MAG: FtsX-like permease family protein, partial [Alistipes sp.]